MFGLDDRIASYSDGATLAVVTLVAIVLGLRHATDPDHLAAVSTLLASARERAARRAAVLGLSWGLGHALTLFAFGLPIVLFEAYLPERVQQGAELTIGVVIVSLSVLLLVRWQRYASQYHAHVHEHGDGAHIHVHSHERGERLRTRSARSAFGIGLVHGLGGSAGVGVLLVATIESTASSVLALALLAVFTGVSMALLSTGFGAGLGRVPMRGLAPALGLASLAFGVWYALGALSLTPYYF